MTTLVSGIFADAQHLLQQQLTMFRQEIRDDLRQSKEAGLSLARGIGILLAGSILLLLMLPLLLHEALPELPLWACFGIVGGMFTAVGWVLVHLAAKKFGTLNPLSDSSIAAFKENLKWTTSSK
jgi:UDP-N-acetylmuramyl pentapeptide phosphotransferase/UDP-N-acetylglucosamine-1-phosphate transferase